MFKVGDLVKVIGSDGFGKNLFGKIGKVLEVGFVRVPEGTTILNNSYGIEFTENVDGHDLGLYGHHCENGHGYYVSASQIELAEDSYSNNDIQINDIITVSKDLDICVLKSQYIDYETKGRVVDIEDKEYKYSVEFILPKDRKVIRFKDGEIIKSKLEEDGEIALSDFLVGDKVRVIDSGLVYPTYRTWFENNNQSSLLSNFNKSETYEDYSDKEGYISAIGKYSDDDDRILACLRLDGGEIILINIDGIESLEDTIDIINLDGKQLYLVDLYEIYKHEKNFNKEFLIKHNGKTVDPNDKIVYYDGAEIRQKQGEQKQREYDSNIADVYFYRMMKSIEVTEQRKDRTIYI